MNTHKEMSVLNSVSRVLVALCGAAVLQACSDGSDTGLVILPDNVLVLSTQAVAPAKVLRAIERSEQEGDSALRLSGTIGGKPVTIVKLRGKTNHFGRDRDLQFLDYDATVPDTKVWIAEHPYTRDRDVVTDETGWWTMYIVKDTGVDLGFSFVYEKEDWVTTKSNVIPVRDEDNLDLAIQYIDPYFFEFAMLPLVENMMRSNGYPNFFFKNAMVVTVGKSWSSMHDDRLPHGDPGATVSIQPVLEELIGPIYFNEAVVPDLGQADVSLDGGVTWLNMPTGNYAVTANKPGVDYDAATFRITEADEEAGVVLYIASPPDSVEGTNDSGPGEP